MLRSPRVLPPRTSKAFFRANVGWGVIACLCALGVGENAEYAWDYAGRLGIGMLWVSAAFFCLFVLPCVLVIERVISQASRLLPSLIGAAAVGVGICITVLARTGVITPNLTGSVPAGVPGLAMFTGAVMLSCLVLTIVLYPLRHIRPGRIVSQTGTLCWRCAYELTGLPEGAPCPECGQSPQAQISWRPLAAFERFTGRWLVPVAIACALIGPVIYTVRWYAYWRPRREALVRLGAVRIISYRIMGDLLETSDGGFNSRQFDAAFGDAAIFSLADYPDLQLVFAYPNAVRRGADHVAELQIVPTGQSEYLFSAGAFATLDADQAAMVLESGVPEPLLDQMTSAAYSNMAASDYTPTPVDADPYFPP